MIYYELQFLQNSVQFYNNTYKYQNVKQYPIYNILERFHEFSHFNGPV